MKTLKKVLALHKVLVTVSLIATILAILVNLFWNKVLSEMINQLGKDSEMPVRMILSGITVMLLFAVTQYSYGILNHWTCETLAHEMRMGYAKYFVHMDGRTLAELNSGEEMSGLQNELSDISNYLNSNLFNLVDQLLWFLFTFVWLLMLCPKLTILANLPVIPIILYCSFSSKVIKKLMDNSQQYKKEVNGLADTLLVLFPMIRIYDAGQLLRTAFETKIENWERVTVRMERTTARLMSLSGLLSFVPLVFLLGLGGTMVMNGEISLGILYIFMNLSGNVTGLMQNMPANYAAFRKFSANMNRLEKKIWME